MPRSRSTFGPLDTALFVALSLMWGLSFLFIKVAVTEIPASWVVVARTGVGAVALLAIVLIRRRRLPRGAVAWLHLLVLATVGTALPWGAVAWAQRSIPSGLSSLLNSFVPAATLITAAIVGLERVTPARLMGLALATAGTAIIVGGEVGASGEQVLAAAIVFGATLLYGSTAVYAKRYVSGRSGPLAIALGQVLLAFAVSLPTAIAIDGVIDVRALSPDALLAAAGLGFFGTGLAFATFYTLIERVGATNATMVTYAMPIVGVTAGWLVLGESFGLGALLGGPMTIAGIWLIQRDRAPSTSDADDEPTGEPALVTER